MKALLQTETNLDALRAAKATWLRGLPKGAAPPPPAPPTPPPPAADTPIPWADLERVNRRWANLPDDYTNLRQILRQHADAGRWTFDQDRIRLASPHELIVLILGLEFSPELARLYFENYE